MQHQRRPLPLALRLFPILFTHVTQALHTTLPYVLAVYMVRDFLAEKEGQEPSEEAVGSLTGLLGACFCAAQLLTSYPLGMLSDRIGRRPIMVLGNLSSTLAGVFFGLSSNFLQAVLTRVGGGLLNGIIGAEKAAAGESLNSVEQATAMAYFSLTWGLGALLGPVVGGMLAKPCEGIMQGSSSPLCAPSGLFQRRPYLLPCVVASGLSAIATMLTAFFMDETLPSRARRGARTYRKMSDMIDEEAATAIEMEMAQQGPKRTVSVEDSAADIERGAPSEALPWYKQRRVILSLTGYASICFIYILIDELTPIFGSAAVKDGGLGFSTSQLAPPLAFSGVTLTIYALWGFPLYRKWLGTARTCRHGLIQTAPVAMLIPMASLPFLSSRGVMWLAMGIKSAAASNSFTSCMILVNESAPPGTLGSVNGVGQTLASAVRAVGPALGGFSWAWSLQLFKALGAPSTFGHQFLPFSIAAGVSLATVGVYAALEPKPSEPVELGPEGDEMR